MREIIAWLESHQISCFYKRFLGVPCPGCGLQTSFIELLKGNLLNSLEAFPLLIPIMFLFVFVVLHLIIKFSFGAKLIKISAIFVGILLALNYLFTIYKFYHHG